VTDDEYELQRNRAILAAFQTGRPVFADNEGEMRYADGEREPLADDVGVPQTAVPQAATISRSWWSRMKCWLGGRSKEKSP
jgi:hypothetical protein